MYKRQYAHTCAYVNIHIYACIHMYTYLFCKKMCGAMCLYSHEHCPKRLLARWYMQHRCKSHRGGSKRQNIFTNKTTSSRHLTVNAVARYKISHPFPPSPPFPLFFPLVFVSYFGLSLAACLSHLNDLCLFWHLYTCTLSISISLSHTHSNTCMHGRSVSLLSHSHIRA